MSAIPRAALVCLALVLACGRDTELASADDSDPPAEVDPAPKPTSSEPALAPPSSAASPDATAPGSGYGSGSGAGFGGRGKRVPAVRHAKAQVTGALDRDIIRATVRKNINDVRACYNAGLHMGPNLQGRVAIEFVIAPSGKVSEAKVQEATVENSNTPQCIVEAVQRWRFPKPEDGKPVTVVYPFNLSPG